MTVVAAWGTKGNYLGRDKEVMKLLPYMKCMGLTKDGYPKHPLYLKKNTKLMSFCKPDFLKEKK